MSLATSCSHCGTIFRVVQDQLKASEGWVRCGHCHQVFNALEGLFDLERREPLPAPPSFPESSGAGEFAAFGRPPAPATSELPGPSAWGRSEADAITTGGFRYGESFTGGFQSPLARVLPPAAPAATAPLSAVDAAATPHISFSDQLALSIDPNDPAWAETKPALFSDLAALRQRQTERQEAEQARQALQSDEAETADLIPDEPHIDAGPQTLADETAPAESETSAPEQDAFAAGLSATPLVTRPGLRTWREQVPQGHDGATLDTVFDDNFGAPDDAGPLTSFEPTVWSVEWLPPSPPPPAAPGDEKAAQEIELSLDIIQDDLQIQPLDLRREPDFSSLDEELKLAPAAEHAPTPSPESFLQDLDVNIATTTDACDLDDLACAPETEKEEAREPASEAAAPEATAVIEAYSTAVLADQSTPTEVAPKLLDPVASTAPASLESHTESALEAKWETEPAAAPSTPSFIQAAERQARWTRPWMRASLCLLALASAAVLTGQAALHWRDLLAARSPLAREWLSTACAELGCTLAAPRRLDALVVDSTALMQPPGIEGYKLQVQLRNRVDHDVAAPWIDLSLSDSHGDPITRRMLKPGDFQQPEVMSAQTDVTWQIEFTAPGQKIAGYTLSVFYP